MNTRAFCRMLESNPRAGTYTIKRYGKATWRITVKALGGFVVTSVDKATKSITVEPVPNPEPAEGKTGVDPDALPASHATMKNISIDPEPQEPTKPTMTRKQWAAMPDYLQKHWLRTNRPDITTDDQLVDWLDGLT